MSLTEKQLTDTRFELIDNFKKTGLTLEEIADDLKCSKDYLIKVFNLNSDRLEDPWILRNYLIENLTSKNINITPFTALVGNSEDYWFLDSEYINNNVIK